MTSPLPESCTCHGTSDRSAGIVICTGLPLDLAGPDREALGREAPQADLRVRRADPLRAERPRADLDRRRRRARIHARAARAGGRARGRGDPEPEGPGQHPVGRLPRLLGRQGDLGGGVGGRAEVVDGRQVGAGLDVHIGGAGDRRREDEARVDGVASDLDRAEIRRDHVAGPPVAGGGLVEEVEVAEDGERDDGAANRQDPEAEAQPADQLGRDQQQEDPADVLIAAGGRVASRGEVDGGEQPEGQGDRAHDPQPARHRAQPVQADAPEHEGERGQRPPPVERADPGLVARRREAEQRRDARGDAVEHVHRRSREVRERGVRLGRVAPAHPPQRVQGDRDRDDPDAGAPGGPGAHRDGGADRERDPEAGEGEAHDEQRAGQAVAGPIVAPQRQQRAEAGRHRAEVADLKSPEQVLPRGAAEEHQERRPEREPVPHPPAQPREQQRGAGEERRRSRRRGTGGPNPSRRSRAAPCR